jgi:Cu-Zn family superoxide dismutase
VRGLLSVLAVGLLAACQTTSQEGSRASAQLQPTRDSKASGTVSFQQQRTGKVRMVADVTGLVPGREHGFHIHEAGDCSSGDGMSAKGHFNPHMKPHGRHGSAERHAGDLPPLKADEKGEARIEQDLDIITIAPGPASIIGRGIIVHADPDDYTTQPTGNAGARLACGVIQRS